MTETITPNIDKLAKSATVFHRAYCQQAVRRLPLALPTAAPPPSPALHAAGALASYLLASWEAAETSRRVALARAGLLTES